MVTFKNISETAQYIELCGDMYGRAFLILDIDKNRIFAEYAGQIVGELTENLRMKWNENISERVKILIRKNINLIKNHLKITH